MAFDVQLGTTSDENVKVSKSFAVGITANGTLRENCSVINPVFTIDTNSNISQYNYAYVSAFGRYYYITDIEYDYMGLPIVHMHVDVLMSYSSQIRGLNAIVVRQANNYNLFLEDNLIRNYINPHIFTRRFPAGFNDTPTVVLAVAGNAAASS